MWLGIDLGTLSVKAQLFGAEGEILGEGRAPYPLHTPHEGWAESDPQAWWDATFSAVREAVGRRTVRGVGLSGQMHGVVLVGSDAQPLRPAILWADGRSAPQLKAYRNLSPNQQGALTNPLVAGMAGPTLLWLLEHEPDVYRRACCALQPKDWLRLRLTGEVYSDPSDASGTLLYYPAEDRWADEVIAALGLRRDLLAPLKGSAEVAGTLRNEAADELGLEPYLPIATGAADTAAAIHGSGLSVGNAQLTVGSGAQIVVLTEPMGAPERGLHLFRAASENQWYKMAAMQNAGLALEWARDLLNLSWPEMYHALDTTSPGSGGLIFLPYLTGERTPHLNPEARGGWLGASRQHTREHFARAAFEGVAFAIADGYAALKESDIRVERLRLAGGGTRERLWQQLLADVLEVNLEPITVSDASVRGAARLAAQALGEDLPLDITHDALVRPHENSELKIAYSRFKALYKKLSAP